LAEKWVKTTEHEGLYSDYLITFILYVLVNKSFHFESDIIYGSPSVDSQDECEEEVTVITLPAHYLSSFSRYSSPATSVVLANKFIIV
jgi:hypothetical protein